MANFGFSILVTVGLPEKSWVMEIKVVVREDRMHGRSCDCFLELD